MEQINNFRKSIQFTLEHEVPYNRKTKQFAADGGYTVDPDDPGGETKWGISKRYHPKEDIKNMTLERAFEIYKEQYWDGAGCDKIDWPMCAVVFDSMVNPGVKLVCSPGFKECLSAKEMILRRKDYYLKRISDRPKMMKYYNGWMNRLNDLSKLVDIPLAF